MKETFMILNDKLYNVLKWLVLVAIPATSAAYFGLAPYWGWPSAEQVTGTLAVLATFLGTLIGISNASYYKSDANNSGVLNVKEDEDGTGLYLDLKQDPSDLVGKKNVTFKVNQLD